MKNNNPSSSKPSQINNDSSYNLNNVQTLNQGPRRKRKRKEFTSIDMSYDTAYDLLHSRGLITPIGPIQDPPLERRSPNWNPHAHCKYHQGRGHFTDDCWKIK